MTKVLVIGCGGIGSFFIREIFQLYENNVQGLEELDIVMYDDDEVEEKNLRYQNFEIKELGKAKATALNQRYPFDARVEKITEDKQLEGYDVIVLAVDNGKVRELVYDYVEKNDTYFIDMRSEGRAVSYFTKHKENTLEFLKSTIDPEAPSTSCQLKFELDAGIIQIGNRIIANIGVQLLLNYLRGDKNPAKFIQRF